MKRFDVEEAQENLESLMAMAFNGEDVQIEKNGTLVRLFPLEELLIPGKLWTAEDFYESTPTTSNS